MLLLNLLFTCPLLTGNPGAQAARPELAPTTLQLDLVYPRPNEAHRIVYPFPIVFAIHGAKNLWPYHLKIRWSLVYEENPNHGEVVDGGAFNDNDTFASPQWTEGDYPSGDEDPFYYISWARAIGRSDSAQYRLSWFITLPANCTEEDTSPSDIDSYPPDYEQPWSPYIHGSANFSVSNDAPLDLVRDSCLLVNETFIGGERNTLRVGGTVTKEQCVFYDEDDFRPEPKPCAAKADAALASMMTETMLAAAGCTDKVWPDEVDGRCPFATPGEKEEENSVWRLGRGQVLAALFSAGLGALFAMG